MNNLFNASALIAFTGISLIAPTIAWADKAVLETRLPTEEVDGLVFAPPPVVIQCPQMLLTAAPYGTATNGFNSKGFLIGTATITASVGVAGPYTFLYCSSNSFGGAWIFQQAPAGYSCVASGSEFICTLH